MQNFLTVFEQRVNAQADELAFRFLPKGNIDDAETITYGRLHERAMMIAQQLHSHALQNQPALLMYPPGIEFITAFYACLYSGVIAVPIYPPLANKLPKRLPKIRAIVDDCQAKTILTCSSLQQLAAQFCEHDPFFAQIQIHNTDLTNTNEQQRFHPTPINQDTIALLQYTSGSTGTPKGVVITHEILMANLLALDKPFGLPVKTHTVSWLPVYHDMGLICILYPMYQGGCTTFFPPLEFLKSPLKWLQIISHYGATTTTAPNFAYQIAMSKLTDEHKQSIDLSSLKVAIIGAEVIRPSTVKLLQNTLPQYGFDNTSLFPAYGLAEVTLLATSKPKNEPAVIQEFDREQLKKGRAVKLDHSNANTGVEYVSCGQPMIGTMAIVNPETFQQCANGEIGEIWLNCPNVAKGYWNKAELSQHVFAAKIKGDHKHSFLRTGDLGFIDNGQLFITGRLKNMIIIHGKNYFAEELEQSIEQHFPEKPPAWCACFSVDATDGERLVMIAEFDHRTSKLHDTKTFMETIVNIIAAEYAIDVSTVILIKRHQLPKTSSGKIMRQTCKQQFEAKQLSIIDSLELNPHRQHEHQHNDLSSVHNKIAKLVAENLQINPQNIDSSRPLIDYGLSSVKLMSITAELENYYQCSLDADTLFNYPTIEQLAEYLTSLRLSLSTEEGV